MEKLLILTLFFAACGPCKKFAFYANSKMSVYCPENTFVCDSNKWLFTEKNIFYNDILIPINHVTYKKGVREIKYNSIGSQVILLSLRSDYIQIYYKKQHIENITYFLNCNFVELTEIK